MPLAKEGVALAVEGAARFVAQLKDASKAHGEFIGQLDEGDAAAQKMGGGLGTLGGAASKAMGFIGGLSTTVIAVGAAFAGAVIGVKKLTEALIGLAKQTAPLEGLQAQFSNLTAGIEGGSSAMLSALRAGSSGMIANRDLMRSYNLAASLVNKQFAETLPESLGLVSKAAAATGQDMGYMMDSLVRGIGRVSPLILDNLGIQVAVSEATARATQMFGKEGDALSKEEQQIALSTIALEKLRAKYGEMPSIAGTASAQMAMFQANLQNIKDTLGQFILPAFSSFLQGVNALVSAFSSAISEGGAFYPILVNVGAALSILADGFQNLAHRAADWLDDLSFTWTNKIGGIAQSAIQWGADIVTNFAVGIVDAANVVLTWAMQQIQNILMWWLAPGSPPRVAPDLDKWGLAAFESYLRGMTDADFGILESIQGPLKKFLSGPEFADVSKAFGAALAGGDRGGALAVLTESNKQFGDDVAELARRQFALADATDAVTQAELALVAAQERANTANRSVMVQTAEYNRLLREGASKEILDAQLKRINGAEKERNAALAAAQAAEMGVDTAKSRIDVLKEQVDWQQRFLSQLFGMSDALTEAEKREQAAAKATAGKGKEGAVLPEVVAPTGPAGGIGGAIAKAIEDAKQRIKDSLGGIWTTIKEEFTEKWDTAIGKLGETWVKFRETVSGLWGIAMAKVRQAWDSFLLKVNGVWAWIDEYLIPIFEDLRDLGLLAVEAAVLILQNVWDVFYKEHLVPFWNWLSATFIAGWQAFYSWLSGPFYTWVENTFGPMWESLGGIMKTVKEEMIDAFVDGLKSVETWLKNVHTWLGNVISRFEEWVQKIRESPLLGGSPSPLAIGIETAADALERLARLSGTRLNAALSYQPVAVGTTYRPAGATTYNYSNPQFNFNTTASTPADAGMLEAMILRTVRRALAQGAA